MDEVTIPGRDDERRIFNQVLSQYGEPAFIRRARRVQEAFDDLVSRTRRRRDEMLAIVRLRVGILRALAGEWSALRPWLADEGQIHVLEHMHSELSPRLRIAVERTASPRRLRRSLQELIVSIDRFNRLWESHLQSIDLSHLNQIRENYNRYYVLEKECALRSARLVRIGFHQLEPLTIEEVSELLPPLPVPQLRT